ncbi:glycosyltransferase family 4 protein [Dolichospermum planctonicum]|jgi:glycosyltransferase involved in cell wall biosynthesis|uniref:Glycosyl transferase group 1 n=1 Tax=Dolichospermum planctonicum TaxID=136072 RepID=A0A480AH76_9CYAN|nr:glycosyltransferase family 1 protein [Dolichospermum planctonicum]GCL43702.1 glycosyl transferase group 1 [Dolichospermum planctonicum]
MLKIVIDVTPVDSKPSGVGLYVLNLVENLSKLQHPESFELGLAYQAGLKNWLQGKLDFPENLKHYSNLYQIPIPVRISNLLLDYLPQFFPHYLQPILENPNIFHGNNYTVYPYKNIQKIITIHDLSFIRHPEYINSVVKQYTKRLIKCLEWTDLIITISESSKQDIINYLKVPAEKIFVTPLASRYDANFLYTLDLGKEVDNINYDFSKPYLLFVSTIEPRKNINAIISAFNFLKKRHKIEHQLVLIGRKGWNYEPIFTAIENSPYKNEIHHLDYLSNELVALFYSKADVFLYPSHYEGFGLPVLEAMTLGTPVIASNTSSIPEVTGNAAILIDPNDYMQLAEAILQVISDSQLRQNLINKGKIRADLFSWERTAKETLKAYKSIIQ